ncbi:MAG: hypothetical protein H7321_08555 [Bacteroidia bacterium]|nr:hypothetical protein [Bacteroidia bacterium]
MTQIKAAALVIYAGAAALFLSVPSKVLAGKNRDFKSYSFNVTASDSFTVKGKYKNGKKHGFWRTYDLSGRVVMKEKYKNGELLYYMKFNEKHKVTETRDRKGVVRHYNPCNC